jgi:uncharacterized protein YegL
VRAESNTAGKLTPDGAAEATLISVILDRSGSMHLVREPTIKGFNEFVDTQKKLKDGGSALMSLVQFNDRYEVNFIGEPIENVPELDGGSYVPQGTTALHDAIGRTIRELEGWTRKNDWKGRVLVLIITDGLENASQEYDFHTTAEMIKQKEADGWNFAYMGANQDSFAVGHALNVRAGFRANFEASTDGMLRAYLRMARGASTYRSSKLSGMAAPSIYDDAEDPKGPDPLAGKLTPKGK